MPLKTDYVSELTRENLFDGEERAWVIMCEAVASTGVPALVGLAVGYRMRSYVCLVGRSWDQR
ncbi:hypothetical protein SAMN05443247_05711 [Bradyrhizobium erythrophlei]|nr:hypothetical protein SAMN05443247_05711 [Bradyrhizobium erythrophlei]